MADTELNSKLASMNNSFLGQIPTNPLDNFNNVTYNIKLYMIPPTEDNTETTGDGSGDKEPRDDVGGQVTNRGGFLNGAYVASPGKTIVLAQTGVTGTLIDNVEIMSVPSGKGGKITQTISCVIKQPGAANFFDMIVLGRRRLGIPPLSGKGVDAAPFFFEINFQGYEDDVNDHDNGGAIKHVAGPFRYKALLKNARFALDSTGTTYDLDFAIADDLAFTDTNFKTPTTFTTKGADIDTHIEDFKGQWNKYNESISSEDQSQIDTIEFKLDNLTGEGQTIIKDPILDRGFDSTADVNPEQINKSGGDRADGTVNKTDQPTRDFSNPQPEEIKIEVPAGTDISTYIGMLLARNVDFTNGITRTMFDEKGDFKYDSTKTFVHDYKINGYVRQVEYDESRQGYAKQVVFTPGVFETPSGKQFALKEELETTEEEIQRRVQSMDIKRAYEYIFTGRNDQILNVDLKYDLGINFLIPPEGGTRFGNAVLNNISNFSIDPAESGEPLSGKSLASFAAKFQDAKRFFNLFKAAKDGSIRDLAKAAGLDENQIKEVIQDRVGATATALVNSLSDRQIGQAVANAILPKGASNQSGTATESDRQRLIDSSVGEDYDPKPSGYIYGGDLLGGQETYLDALSEDVAKDEIQENIEDEVNALKPGVEASSQEHETYSGGPATKGQTLFGYMYGQKDTADILYTLDMVVRGDPWYLGKPDLTGTTNYEDVPAIKDEKSTSEYFNSYGGDNFILFELRQPMYFDPFINNEDLNEGMYPIGRQSYFITGIYRILELVSSFDNGRFTVNVRTCKELTLDLSKIKNKDDITLDSIKENFEKTLKVKAVTDAAGHNAEDDKERFNDPDYTKSLLDFGGGLTIDELAASGLISSEQVQIYKAKYGG